VVEENYLEFCKEQNGSFWVSCTLRPIADIKALQSYDYGHGRFVCESVASLYPYDMKRAEEAQPAIREYVC